MRCYTRCHARCWRFTEQTDGDGEKNQTNGFEVRSLRFSERRTQKFKPQTSCRAFLARLALHVVRSVAPADFPHILLDEFRFDQVQDLTGRVA
jgi:hypothetical protein